MNVVGLNRYYRANSENTVKSVKAMCDGYENECSSHTMALTRGPDSMSYQSRHARRRCDTKFPTTYHRRSSHHPPRRRIPRLVHDFVFLMTVGDGKELYRWVPLVQEIFLFPSRSFLSLMSHWKASCIDSMP